MVAPILAALATPQVVIALVPVFVILAKGINRIALILIGMLGLAWLAGEPIISLIAVIFGSIYFLSNRR